MSDSYRLIFTIRILAAFQLVAMNVGGGGAGVRDVISDLGIDGMGI